jgi:UDP:flavonoid glycosyltransferase YjiC (YdhE family)
MTSQPTVALFPEPGAWGPTNNLVALGNHLRERGIRTVFVIEESFEGELAERGFEERMMRMAPPPEGEEAVGGGWAEFVRETSPQFRRPTIEQLETVTAPIWAEFVDGAEYSHDRLTEIWSELRPDAIVHDCVASFPSVSLAGCPWIRVVSASPLEITDPDIPPVFSGYQSRNRSGWDDFWAEYRRLTDPLVERVNGVSPAVRCTAVAGWRIPVRITVSEPLHVSGRARLRAVPAARPDVAPHRHVDPQLRRPFRHR